LQGASVLCFAFAYLFVQVVRYEDPATRHIAWGSVLNSAICFTLAAIAVGLYSGSVLRCRGRVKIVIPCALAAVTVLGLYIAQFFMLDRSFYSFGSSAFAALAVRILVVVFPSIAVYLLLRFAHA